jgi:hypothetical protein
MCMLCGFFCKLQQSTRRAPHLTGMSRSACLLVCASACLPVCLSACLLAVCRSVRPLIRPSVRMPCLICWSILLPVCLLLCLCLSFHASLVSLLVYQFIYMP